MSTATVIIPAAGRGRRMGDGPPKQYRSLGDRAVLWHTLSRFQASPRVHAVVVAIHPDDRERFSEVRARGEFDKLREPVVGGVERADSVWAALRTLPDSDDLVLVHDAVRPWVTVDLIDRVVSAAERHGAAIPVVPVTETVKAVKDGVVLDSPLRSRLYNAQTPQGFHRAILQRAFQAAEPGRPATDEATLVERTGAPVHVVEGDYRNVKITTPDDLSATGETRIGIGYDVHAFADERPLVLGGVHIEAKRGLAGHSDADVLTHAVIDALLGATRMGDIGRLFPDHDPAYENISSLILLGRVRDRLDAAGAAVVNIDAVVMAQAPKLASHVDAMSAALARALHVDPERISLKATTTERLGFVGRQEGIAAQAVALVRVA